MTSQPIPGAAPPRVLVVDDDRITREFFGGLLRGHGMMVDTADSGQQAVSRIREELPHLILLDSTMPGFDGFSCCRLIKSIAHNTFLPVLLLTADSDVDARLAGLRSGADDCLAKPVDERELLARIHSMLAIKHLFDQVQESKARLEMLALQDELTGLFNHRYLHTRLNDEFKRAERYREPLACVMADVDHFKRINERSGYEAGDGLLREIAGRLRKAVRDIDVVTRYGGEEFMLVLPSTNFAGALSVAGRAWSAIRGEPFRLGAHTERISLSLGVAVFPSRDIKSTADLVHAADRAMCQAKAEGRDRICVFQHQNYIYRPATSQPSL